MPRLRTVLTPLAVAVAAGTLAATGVAPATAAAPAATGTVEVAPMTGCASLSSNSPGRARIQNICNHRINATVSVDWAWDPPCVSIKAKGSAVVTWDSTKGRAEYAYEC